MSLLLGYNTNGFAHHRLTDAIEIISSLGYRAVGLTIDVHHAPLESTDFRALGARMKELLFESAYALKDGSKIINPAEFIRLVKVAK